MKKQEIKSIINEKKWENADAIIVSAPYDKTASSHKGTVNGPKKVIQNLNTQIEFFDREYQKEIIDYVKISHTDLGNLNKFKPEQVYQKINKTVEKIVNANKFVFILGGEHSVPLGLLKSLSSKYNPKDVTILQIDAHLDLRNDDSDYSTNPTHLAHSTIMRRAHDLGYNIVNVGARSFSADEYQYVNQNKNIKIFESGYPKKLPKIEDILNPIKTKYLYITIDVDGFDPSVMPGTGTPVPGGLSWDYGMELLDKAISKFELIGADLVEVSPQKETVVTEYASAQLIYSIITKKFKDKLK